MGELNMKLTLAALLVAAPLLASTAAFARPMNADDMKWINQCISDNKGDAAEGVVRKYCMCMNEKMSDNETQSITQWEKSHARERKACDAEAGWK